MRLSREILRRELVPRGFAVSVYWRVRLPRGRPPLITAWQSSNDVFGWMIGDLLAGFNIGAIGSTKVVDGKEVGTLDSQKWFAMMDLFSELQSDQRFYNQWAAQLSEVTQAYNFAYTDRFAHVVTPLDPARVDTLEIVLLGDTHVQVPEPATWVMLLMGGAAVLVGRVFSRRSRSIEACR